MPVIGGLGLLLLALWIFCIIDVITANEWEVRNLPKMGWLLIVILVPTIGSIIWLVAGRPQREGGAPPPRQRGTSRFPEYDRPGRHVAGTAEDDEEFLRRCRERAEQQRRAARESRRTEEES
jgi:hypothetical protein